MNIGFIGTGNMGTILIRSMLDAEAVAAPQLTIMNRTRKKAEDIQEQFPEVCVKDRAEDVITRANIVFLCVRPLDIYPLLQQIKDELTPQHILISITSPVEVEEIESVVNCQVARVIPSIVNRGRTGAALVHFGNSCTSEAEQKVLALIEKISKPYRIDDCIVRVASDISSCGPAFFSYVAQKFVNGALRETAIERELAEALTSEMLIGIGKLLEKEIYTLPQLQKKVCVKGGVTGEGIEELEERLDGVFEALFRRTHKKHHEDREKIAKQFRAEQKRS